MEPLLLNYKNSVVNYYRFGTGPKLVVCFHGYGENARGFEFLSHSVGSQFTLYCVDLPFHGQTRWNDGLSFTETDLLEIIEQILKNSKSRFSLLGYSLGGRMALSIYKLIPEKIDKMVLLAPDGLKVNGWYWLATQTWLGNKFFAFTMERPRWFFALLRLMNRFSLVNTSIFKFVNHYISDATVRQLLYTRWTTFRKIKPDLHQVKKEINNNGTQVRLLYGQHDRIILSSVGEKFRKGIEKNCSLTIINAGHQVLHKKHGEEIVTALLC
jgi:pimeloyl-ACP methyl ester carboxylesterase